MYVYTYVMMLDTCYSFALNRTPIVTMLCMQSPSPLLQALISRLHNIQGLGAPCMLRLEASYIPPPFTVSHSTWQPSTCWLNLRIEDPRPTNF